MSYTVKNALDVLIGTNDPNLCREIVDAYYDDPNIVMAARFRYGNGYSVNNIPLELLKNINVERVIIETFNNADAYAYLNGRNFSTYLENDYNLESLHDQEEAEEIIRKLVDNNMHIEKVRNKIAFAADNEKDHSNIEFLNNPSSTKKRRVITLAKYALYDSSRDFANNPSDNNRLRYNTSSSIKKALMRAHNDYHKYAGIPIEEINTIDKIENNKQIIKKVK